jgi:hypothetical protein
LGNLGRNTLRSPGLNNFDFSVFKNQNLWGERKVQIRAEFFNVFNRTNFLASTVSVLNGNGQVSTGNLALQTPTATTAREIQLGIRFIF